MPLRVRLALVGAGVAGLALLVFGLLFDRLVVIGVPEDQDRHLAELADRAATAVRTADPEQLAPADPAAPTRRCWPRSGRTPIRSSPCSTARAR